MEEGATDNGVYESTSVAAAHTTWMKDDGGVGFVLSSVLDIL